MIFWIVISLAIGCCCATLYFVYSAVETTDNPEASSQDLYLQQKQSLQDDFVNGKISQKALAIAETELARHFIQSSKINGKGQKSFNTLSSKTSNMLMGVSIVFIIGLSFGLYLYLGSPNHEDMPLAARQNAPIQEQSLEQLIARAEARVAKNPNDIRGWKVLAPIYRRLGRIDDAIYAYRTILAAEPNSADAVSELGEISFIQAGRIVNAEAKALFQRATELDGSIIKPQFYLALADFQQGDKQSALAKFNGILKSSPPDAPWRPVVKQYIDAIENPNSAPNQQQAAGSETAQNPDIRQNKQVLAMVQGLAERLEDDPDDIEGWLRLIRSYKVLGNQEAYDKAILDAKAQYKDSNDELAQIEQLIKSLDQ